MEQAKQGDKVKVHYVGSLKDGTIFGSSLEEPPFEFTIGHNQVLPGFEKAVIGMKVGESKKISLLPEEAYGPHNRELVFEVDRSDMPSAIDLELGKVLRMKLKDGTILLATIKKLTEDTIIFDGNNPLAGKELFFEIKLLEIK